MDESVVTGNITRIVENACHDELALLNRGPGTCSAARSRDPDNPLAPVTIVDAFADALRQVKTESRIKFQILKELNQASLGDIASIYGDINRHLANLRVVPGNVRPAIIQRGNAGDHRRQQAGEARERAAAETVAAAEVDVMALFRRMFGAAASSGAYAGHSGAPSIGAMPGFTADERRNRSGDAGIRRARGAAPISRRSRYPAACRR